MSSYKLFSGYSKRVAVFAVCMFMLFAQTGCMTLLKIGAKSEAEDVAIAFVEDFIKHPDSCDFSKYCDEEPDHEFTDEQLLILFELTSDVKCKVKKSQLNDSMEKATVYVQLSDVCDVNEFDNKYGTVDELLEEADEIGTDTRVVKFTLKLNKKGDWVIYQMDEFIDLFIEPYMSLQINDGTTPPSPNNTIVVVPNIGSDTVSSADLVLNAYIYSVWLDVEMEFPLTEEDLMVESAKSYAVLCAFYFNTPINGTFTGVLLDGDGNTVMTGEFHITNEVLVECDFSAGLAGFVRFDPGKYHVELYYEDNLVATSEEITIL